MDNPRLRIERTQKDGKMAIEVIVNNANAELRQLLDSLGYAPTEDILNRCSIVCTTPAELDAARNPLASLFDKTGAWIVK